MLVRALQYRREKMTPKVPAVLERENIIGNSPALKKSFQLLAQAAAGDVSVLITGETGTGKELFASAIHQNSARAKGNFVVVDCAALPETLVESLLFGHKKGAFTIDLPPLRERKDDIALITLDRVHRLCLENKTSTTGISPELLESLNQYDWPGNVRELIQTIDRSFAAAQHGTTLHPAHLPAHLRVKMARKSIGNTMTLPEETAAKAPMPGALSPNSKRRETQRSPIWNAGTWKTSWLARTARSKRPARPRACRARASTPS